MVTLPVKVFALVVAFAKVIIPEMEEVPVTLIGQVVVAPDANLPYCPMVKLPPTLKAEAVVRVCELECVIVKFPTVLKAAANVSPVVCPVQFHVKCPKVWSVFVGMTPSFR